jgi:outer membrane lipoprotein-sorting protein
MDELLATVIFGFFLCFASFFKPAPTPPPPPPEPTAKARAQLTSVLANYEKTRKEMKSFRISFTRTNDDLAFRTRTVVKGEAAGAGVDLLRVDYKGVENTSILRTDKEIVLYDYESKTKRVFKLGATSERPAQNGFFAGLYTRILNGVNDQRLLFARMPVEDLKKRFEVRFLKDEDAHYYYLELRSKDKDDEYATLHVALIKKTLLPRTIIATDHLGHRTQWDFLNFETNVTPPITLESLTRDLQQGWTTKDLQQVWKKLVFGEEGSPKP